MSSPGYMSDSEFCSLELGLQLIISDVFNLFRANNLKRNHLKDRVARMNCMSFGSLFLFLPLYDHFFFMNPTY